MISRFIESLVNFFFESKHKWLIQVAIFFIVISPLVITTYFQYIETKKDLTELILSRRESLAHIGTIALKEKFDRLTDISFSLATRVRFRQLVGERKWGEAIKILNDVPQNFPFIDRILLVNPKGVLEADIPEVPEVRGTDFSFRDWYKGVIATQKPYISEVYRRQARPQRNVIAISAPIRNEEQIFVGILVLQVRLDTIFEWSKEIEVGPEGFVYFVDRNAHIAGHPRFPPQEEITDFSSVPVVQRVLSGESGVGIFYNPIEKEERLSAYEKVSEYGWGVIVQQPTLTAFASRDERLRQILIVNGIILFVAAILVFFLLRFIKTLYAYRQKEKVFLESIGDGLVAIDRYWNITLWNNAASFLTGWSKNEVLGKPLREIVKFVRASDRTENIHFIEETMLYGKPYLMENNTLLIRKDKSEVYVGDSAAPIFDEGGKVTGAIVIFRDISKHRELEKSREEFYSLASHQLRSPVTVIKGYTETLLEEGVGQNNEQWKKYLEEIQKAAGSLNNLVNALLNVSRIEVGTLAVNPEPAYLPDISDSVLNSFLPQIQSKNLRVGKSYGQDIPSISVDIKLMQAVFQNLLSNAIRYTPPGGQVGVAIDKQEHGLLIRIWDTGLGIPKEEQSKVFSKFFRASNVSQIEGEGTGLGLYIVKSIVEQSGGKVWFESEQNQGTIFYLTIPLEGMNRKEGTKGLT